MNDATLQERFDAKVIKNADGCWGWTGGSNRDRPYLWMDGRVQVAYRASWVLHVGPIPEGMFVCHHCDNGMCCRPDHLFLGTHLDNMRDMHRKGRHAYGVMLPNARLNPDLVKYIRREYAAGRTQRSLAEEIGVVRPTIGHVVRGSTWKEVMA